MKRTFQEWVKQISPLEAEGRLRKRDFSPRWIERMLSGDYNHEPRGAIRAILIEEMAKDGFTLVGNEAS